ncbi:hypothetical protein [Solirubrobacter soli]|uniref:hypothetical protein n=1 Tax=Solirubrobacter soli TaxID=363832 RepID=UPI00047F5330|nr:hypothetical protein [Solirubrobacter soli]
MEPIIWGALIAGGVSLVGNAATVTVALFGRNTQREQIASAANVEVAKIGADSARTREDRREHARRERRDLYARFLTVVSRLQGYGGDDPPPTDEELDRTNREFESLFSEVLLAGTDDVGNQASAILAALHRVGEHMDRFEGGSAARFRAAYCEHDPDVPFPRRGDAVVGAKGGLLWVMRQDVTMPHLPESATD